MISKNRKNKPSSSGYSTKGEAHQRFRKIANDVKLYKGGCLFPVDMNGELCPEPPSRRHVISRSSVLDDLKDQRSGKVLDLDWGVDQWSALLLKSDEEHPVNLEDPATFKPRGLGTHEACTGPYACQTHDSVFNPIDVANPDFSNPYIRWLTMGRIVLYGANLCSHRKFLVDTWKSNVIRSPSKALRTSWMREWGFAYTAYERARNVAKLWGGIWQSLESPDRLPDNLVESSVLPFWSRLRMAACILYGQATAVVVHPGEGDEHKMVMLHWSEDTSVAAEDENRLANKARETEVGDDYGVDMLDELMSRGFGAVAASPVSYEKLANDQRIVIQKILMRNIGVAILEQIFREGR